MGKRANQPGEVRAPPAQGDRGGAGPTPAARAETPKGGNRKRQQPSRDRTHARGKAGDANKPGRARTGAARAERGARPGDRDSARPAAGGPRGPKGNPRVAGKGQAGERSRQKARQAGPTRATAAGRPAPRPEKAPRTAPRRPDASPAAHPQSQPKPPSSTPTTRNYGHAHDRPARSRPRPGSSAQDPTWRRPHPMANHSKHNHETETHRRNRGKRH